MVYNRLLQQLWLREVFVFFCSFVNGRRFEIVVNGEKLILN